jgi:phosphoglucosamine mutase
LARIFGTDGIRGRAGEGWLSPAGVAAVGRAAGEVLARRDGRRRALLGHDGRRSGPELAAALAHGLRSKGFEVASAGLITTPGLALATRMREFDLGAMLSASHNPAEDNGVKLFSATGRKLSDEIEVAIEGKLAIDPADAGPWTPPPLDPEIEKGYLAYLVDKVGARLSLSGLTVVVDCANGGASRIAPRVFGRLGARVVPIHAEPDGENINRGCGSTHPESLQAEVRQLEAGAGIALDGDGDRCLLVDERGQLVDGDGILTVIARQRAAKWRDKRVVATVMSNKGLHKALRDVGVGVVTVAVGDRCVVEALEREDLALGGEQSGHVVFGRDHHWIGDGVVTALAVLRVMVETGKGLAELASSFHAFPQVLLNVRVARKPQLSTIPAIAEAVQRIERELGADGRVLLRYSGTEPLARVMVEGPDAATIQGQAQALARLIAAEIGA